MRLQKNAKCLEWFYLPLFCPSFFWNPIGLYLITIYWYMNEFTDKRFTTDEGPRAFRLVIHILLSPTRLYLYNSPSVCKLWIWLNWDARIHVSNRPVMHLATLLGRSAQDVWTGSSWRVLFKKTYSWAICYQFMYHKWYINGILNTQMFAPEVFSPVSCYCMPTMSSSLKYNSDSPTSLLCFLVAKILGVLKHITDQKL